MQKHLLGVWCERNVRGCRLLPLLQPFTQIYITDKSIYRRAIFWAINNFTRGFGRTSLPQTRRMIITRSTNMSQTPHRYLKLLKVNPATFSNVMPQFAEALEELNLSAHSEHFGEPGSLGHQMRRAAATLTVWKLDISAATRQQRLALISNTRKTTPVHFLFCFALAPTTLLHCTFGEVENSKG